MIHVLHTGDSLHARVIASDIRHYADKIKAIGYDLGIHVEVARLQKSWDWMMHRYGLRGAVLIDHNESPGVHGSPSLIGAPSGDQLLLDGLVYQTIPPVDSLFYKWIMILRTHELSRLAQVLQLRSNKLQESNQTVRDLLEEALF